MKRILAAAAIAALSAPAAHAAGKTTLKFGFPAPMQSKVNVWGTAPWAAAVKKDAKGTLDIKFFYGNTLGTVQNMYDRTIQGVANLSFGIFGPLAGQFKKIYVTTLPFESKNDLEASKALWQLYSKGVIADEFTKVKVLALFTFPHAGFHTNKLVRDENDLKGLKIATSDRVMGQFITLLGASPVTMGPPEYYQAVSRGLTDGIAVGWSAVTTFKLDEVTKYHMDVTSGLAGAYMFMNKASYNRLPDVARKAIDAHSGEPYFTKMGEVTDRMDTVGRKLVEKKPGHSVTDVSDEVAARWKKLAQPIIAGWVARTPDGAKVLAAYREAIQKIRKGM